MTCPDEDLIAAFARAELAGPQRRSLEDHLDGCQSCGRVVAELVRVFSDDDGGDAVPRSGDLEETVLSEPGASRVQPALLAPGDRVGRYRVLDSVGAGNMGVVYAAYDPELDRRIALKLLRSEDGDEDKKVRLQREAQALARLSHPNVIAVHDVGSFRDRVWLAMEFVDGWTLTQWLEEQPRSWEEVRGAFVAAGQGLAAAHAAGLVHRDFKPDNVLIGRDGRVRVTDFGLARLEGGSSVEHPVVEEITDAGDGVVSANMTATGAMVGTPAYMAPEQFARETVDALSDQFSFCVALYEAVWGKRPYEGSNLARLAANVLDGRMREPPRDGRVPPRVRRALMRGLSRKRTDRFPSMTAVLAELAPPPHRGWKTLLWMGVPAALAAGGALALDRGPDATVALCRGDGLAGVWDDAKKDELQEGFVATAVPHASQTWAAVEPRIEHWVADWQAQRAQVCSPDREGALVSLRMVCLERKRDELGAVLDVLHEPDADVMRRAPAVMGTLPDLEPCIEPGRHAERQPPPPSELEPTVAQLRVELAQVKAMLLAGRQKAGLEQAQELDREAQALGYEPLAAETRWMLGMAWSYAGRNEKAHELMQEAMVRAIAAGDRRSGVRIMVELIYVAGHQNQQHVLAEHLAGLAEAEIQALGGDWSTEAARLVNLGDTYVTMGRAAEALEAMQRAYDLLREHEVGPVRLGDVVLNVATIEMMLDRYEDAQLHFEETRRLYLQGWGEGHPALSDLYQNHGQMLVHTGRFDNAARYIEQARELRREALGPDHPEYAKSLATLASIRAYTGHAEEAIELQTQAIQIVSQSYRADHPRVLVKRGELATVYQTIGRHEDAKRELEDILALARESLGMSHPKTGEFFLDLTGILFEQGRFGPALESARQAEAIYAQSGQPDGPAALVAMSHQGECLYMLRRYDEAAKLLADVIPRAERREELKSHLPSMHLVRAQALWELGDERPARVAEIAAWLPVVQVSGTQELFDSTVAWLAERTQ